MKRFIAVVVAIATVVVMAETETQAQSYLGGYQFGAGIQAPIGSCGRFQREQPPYFAKFPPVYYSHIVKRPYGISPYAAPAGIAPVEMSVPMAIPMPPVTKINPYYTPNVEPVGDQSEAPATEVKDKLTWKANPFFANTIEGIVAN